MYDTEIVFQLSHSAQSLSRTYLLFSTATEAFCKSNFFGRESLDSATDVEINGQVYPEVSGSNFGFSSRSTENRADNE